MATELGKHLNHEHKQSTFTEYLREIVYGGTDGIVTTFAVVAGFSGASLSGDLMLELSFMTVLLFGMANLFADATSMGLGNILAIKAERDVFNSEKSKERIEIQDERELEKAETIDLLKEKGFSDEDAQTLTNIYTKNEDYWVDWMMHHELKMPNPENINPLYTGFATFVAFIIFGAVPLLPYMVLNSDAKTAFISSSAGALLALFLLGLTKYKVIGGKLVRSVAEIVIIGGAAAIVAFSVGIIFPGI